MEDSTSEKKAKPRVSAGKIIAIVLAVIVAYCCIFSLVAKFVKNESVPMPLGFGASVVLTGSMEPALNVNDLVIVAKSKDYSVGDVVVFQTGGTPVIHRIVDYDPESGVYTTKGDNNNTEDQTPITKSKIKGKLLFSIPLIGWAMNYLRTVPGIIMILILLFTLLFLSARAKEQDEKDDEKNAERNAEIAAEIEALKKKLEALSEGPEKAGEAESGNEPEESVESETKPEDGRKDEPEEEA